MALSHLDANSAVIIACFLIQLVSLSLVLSAKWARQRAALLKAFPEREYPNLYVVPESVESRRIVVRRLLDAVVFTLGLAVLVVALFTQLTSRHWILGYLMFSFMQILPSFLSSFWCRADAKHMSTRYPSAVRKVSLTARKMTDFVSVQKLILAWAMFIAMLVCTIGAALSGALGESAQKGWYLAALGAATGGYLWWRVNSLVYGKKSDNFMTPEDRQRLIYQRINQLVTIVSCYSLFSIGILSIALFGMSQVHLIVVTSVVLQITMFMSFHKTPNINRDVYKQGTD